MNTECIFIFKLNHSFLHLFPLFFPQACPLLSSGIVLPNFFKACSNVISSQRPVLITLFKVICNPLPNVSLLLFHRAYHDLIWACAFFFSLFVVGLLSLRCQLLKGRGILCLIYPCTDSILAQCFNINKHLVHIS